MQVLGGSEDEANRLVARVIMWITGVVDLLSPPEPSSNSQTHLCDVFSIVPKQTSEPLAAGLHSSVILESQTHLTGGSMNPRIINPGP